MKNIGPWPEEKTWSIVDDKPVKVFVSPHWSGKSGYFTLAPYPGSMSYDLATYLDRSHRHEDIAVSLDSYDYNTGETSFTAKSPRDMELWAEKYRNEIELVTLRERTMTKKITIAETFRFPGTDIILEKGDVIEVPVEEATPEKRCECGQLLTGEAKLCEVCAANNERNEDAPEEVNLEEMADPRVTKELKQMMSTMTLQDFLKSMTAAADSMPNDYRGAFYSLLGGSGRR